MSTAAGTQPTETPVRPPEVTAAPKETPPEHVEVRDRGAEAAEIISPYVLNKVAGSHLLATNFRDAEAALLKAKRYYPGYATTYANLGRLYGRRREYRQAEEALRWATWINPFDPFVRKSLYDVYRATGREEQAERQLAKLKVLLGAE